MTITGMLLSLLARPPNNIVFVCKSHYIDKLVKELGIDNSLGNPTYTLTTLAKEEILDNQRSVLCSFGISTKDEELDRSVKSTYNLGPSPPAIALKHLSSLPFTRLFLTLS
jgi:hypothetical protein